MRRNSIGRRRILQGAAAISLAAKKATAFALAFGFRPTGGSVPSPPVSLKAVSLIGTASGRDFPTIDAWLAAVSGLGTISKTTYPNGVIGQCYNDSEFTPGELIFRNVDTSQFNGSGIFAITLTAAPGQSFADNANNAIAYTPVNGVSLNFNQASYPITGGAITIANTGVSGTTIVSSNILISRLQIKVSTGNYGIYTDNNSAAGVIQLQQLIIDDLAGGQAVFSGTVTRGYNCCVIVRGPQDPNVCPHGGIFDGPAGVGGKFYGWDIVSPSDNTNGLPAGSHPHNGWSSSGGEGQPIGNFVGTTTFGNCGFFGWQQVSDVFPSGGQGAAYTGCATDVAASTTTNLYCTGHVSVFTGRIDNGTPGTAGTRLTVTAVSSGTLAVGQYVGGTYGGSIDPPNFTKITALGTGTGGVGTYTIDTSLNIPSQQMTTFVPTNPNTGAGVAVAKNYINSFVGTTGAAANFRLKSGSPLIGAGTADPTNLSTDIFGNPRPLTGSIDIGCHQFTPLSTTFLVNGSNTPPPVFAGDGLHVAATGLLPGTNIRVTLEDSASTVWNSVGYVAYTSSTVDFVMQLSEQNNFGTRSALGTVNATTPGTYHARLYYDTAPSVIQADVAFTVNKFASYPFPLLNAQIGPNSMGQLNIGVTSATGGTVLAGNSGFCKSVQGNIAVNVAVTGGAGGLSPAPTNITMQFYAVDGALTYHPIGNSPSTGPVFGSPPAITSFNTSGLADGSYVIFAKIIDIADSSVGLPAGQHWSAPVFVVIPVPIIIQNGATPMNPASNYMIPALYYGNNRRVGSTTPDAVPYRGVPVGAASSPYPSDASAGNYLLPYSNSSSPFFGNPTAARNPPLGFWWQGADGIRTNEYKSAVIFAQTQAGGIFSESWFGKTTGDQSFEGSYPQVARGAYRDGPRNSNQTTNFTTVIATPATGPWSAYHWTFIQEDGRLGVMDLAGNKATIAGPRLDPTKLMFDWQDSSNPEFPQSQQVGTIDTNPLYTFGDFGGGTGDCCWDPRDPFICYVSQTVDHCIIKINFHTQTLGGVNYSASNPLCQRYAGFKGGINGLSTAAGGYLDGPALGTVTGSVQANATFTASISGTTLTISSGVTGTIVAGQALSDTTGNIAGNTRIVSGGGTTWTIAPSQSVSSEAMFTSNGAQFNGVYSITMQHRTDNPSYPQGTMFVADNYNGLIRVITNAAIDSNGNFSGAGPTVSTLVGTHGGAVPVSTAVTQPFIWNTNVIAATTTIAITSMTDNGDGTASVVLASPSHVASVGWRIMPLVGGATYRSGGVTFDNGQGIYTVSAFTDSQHFKLTLNPVPTGSLSAFICDADVYSSPLQVSFANAYTPYPNTIRMTSLGDLVIGESWYNMLCRRIWLNNNPNSPSANWNTITRLLAFGNSTFAATPSGVTNSTAFGWFDIDITGACGPPDDIVSFKSDSNPGSAANAFRFSLDLSYNSGGSTFQGGQWFGDGGVDFPSEGPGGVGHYPWGFCFSRTAFRILSIGLDPTGWFQWRPKTPSDPDHSVDTIGGAGAPISTFQPYLWLDSGWVLWQQGSRGILPYGIRPALAAMMGSNGIHFYGSNTGPTLDDLPGLYPTNAALAAYIQGTGTGQTGAFFGSVKRPEFSFDDDGVTPGRALAALMYFIRRQAISGAWPAQLAPLFAFAYQTVSDGTGVLTSPGQWSLNYTRPNITVTSPGGVPQRVTNTSIRVQWTTDKNTLGIVCAGTPNSNVASPFDGHTYLYNFYTTLEMDNAAAWGTTHDVTITGLPDKTVTPPAGTNAPNNVAVLVIDRAGNWNVTSNFVVS